MESHPKLSLERRDLMEALAWCVLALLLCISIARLCTSHSQVAAPVDPPGAASGDASLKDAVQVKIPECAETDVSILQVPIHPRISPHSSRLVMVSPAGAEFLDSLTQLAGHVRIPNAEAALRYVRFRTSPQAGISWPHYEVEVRRAAPGTDIIDTNSGGHGLLSESAFRAGGFHDATLQRSRDGWVIDRYLFVDRHFQPLVLHVRESVRSVGDYRRTVIFREEPPVLPGVNWQTPLRY